MQLKYDIPESQIDNYKRYNELFLKGSTRTTEEDTEFNNLQQTLSPYLITAQDWNNLEDEILTPLYQTVTSEGESVISLPESTIDKGQVSDVILKGRTLKQELNYDRETWAEWTSNYPTQLTKDSTGLTMTADNTNTIWAELVTNLKTNTKYGLLINVLINEMSGTGYAAIRTDSTYNASNSYPFSASDIGNIKFVFTTGNSFVANKLRIALSELETAGNRIKFTDVRVFELPTGSEIESDFTNLTANELAEKYPYIKGDSVKSTVCAYRIKDTGKNLFDKNKAVLDKLVNPSTGQLTSNTSYSTSNFIKVKPSQSYTISSGVADYYYHAFYDINKNYISGGEGGATNRVITTPSNAYYFRIAFTKSNIDNLQIEEGSVKTTYEEYKEDTSYIIGIDENGNVIKLNSLENGTKDEFCATC